MVGAPDGLAGAALSHEEAVARLLEGAGTQFDAAFVRVFATLALQPADDALVPLLDPPAPVLALAR